MRLNSSSFSTLALFVNVVCLLVVLVLESAVCVKFYHDCSNQFLSIYPNGSISTQDDPSEIYQNFSIVSVDSLITLAVFAQGTHRFLCFTRRGKLLASKKFRGISCLFYEEMLKSGYTRYRSSICDEDGEFRYIGLNKRGTVLKKNKLKELTKQQEQCLNFLKQDARFNIGRHNGIVAGHHNAPPPSTPSHAVPSLRLPADLTSKLASAFTKCKSHHMKIRHRNHHHQRQNEIT